VWNPSTDWREFGLPGAGKFDLHEAWSCWDDAHRGRRHEVAGGSVLAMTAPRLSTPSAMLEALQAGRGTLTEVKNPHAVALGRLGGLKGGPRGGRARAEALSAPRRAEIARRAAAARWGQLPEALRGLFPDFRFEALSLPRDLDLVMLRVLGAGGQEHTRWLVRRFGDAGVRRWLVKHKGGGLPVAQMRPWVSERTARGWRAMASAPQFAKDRARHSGSAPHVAVSADGPTFAPVAHESEALNRVRARLAEAGAPLSGSGEPTLGRQERLEELALDAVRVAPLDATLTRALPLFFWRNRARLDPGTLAGAARGSREARAMGFFLDLTGELSGDQSFCAAANDLRPSRSPSKTYFFRSSTASPFAREAARRNTPEVARRWGYFMNMPLDSFRTLFDKFTQRHATSRAI
jgi:hypothetical protein